MSSAEVPSSQDSLSSVGYRLNVLVWATLRKVTVDESTVAAEIRRLGETLAEVTHLPLEDDGDRDVTVEGLSGWVVGSAGGIQKATRVWAVTALSAPLSERQCRAPMTPVDAGATVLADTDVTDIKTVWKAVGVDTFESGRHEAGLGNGYILPEPGSVVRLEPVTDTISKS